ncbi:ARM repeat superfamily protein [Citrus sinensis]|uniref:ARM repeat superfamily protein n=1 Tax=Citrus sinensis TaxID=2711 RepID=A0ACB8ITQ4_CITSI|nr:ARM repeat superfamily protein [Citrus sinensis]
MTFEDKEEEEEEAGEDHHGPSHHPPAPPDEASEEFLAVLLNDSDANAIAFNFFFFIFQLFDIATSVDPSYIISLIRKLLPNVKNDHNFCGADGDSAPNEGSKIDLMGESASSSPKDRVRGSPDHNSEAMDVVNGFEKSSYQDGDDENLCRKVEQPGVSAGEEVWEEYGCVLWDLAASRNHAELMVENLVLEVLLANLMIPQTVRVAEIILGIIGNLACHEVLMQRIVSTQGLNEIIVDQLFLDDTQCLIEACRLLTLCLQGSECIIWAEKLQSEHILQRVLWIAENTLNPQLIEKNVGLLLAILESRPEVARALHPPLMKLGLPSVLIDLLAFEMNKLLHERIPERYPALEVILRSIEALSVLDSYSQEITLNKKLLQLVCDLIKFPDKVEVANSCVTAVVVLANILSDIDDLASEISQDLPFIQGLLEMIPFASDDLEARSALWSIVARILVKVQEDEMRQSSLHQYVSVLVSSSDMIEDDLLDHQLDETSHRIPCGFKRSARVTAVSSLTC